MTEPTALQETCGDGWSNLSEYRAGTDPSSIASPLPTPPRVAAVHPHDGAGVSDAVRIPVDASFAVMLPDGEGIDLTDPESVILTIDAGVNSPYDVTLEDTGVLRVVKTSADADTHARSLWVVYERSCEEDLGDYPFSQTVLITVQAKDRMDYWMQEQTYSFRVESEQDHREALLASPATAPLPPGDPVLDGEYDTGIRVISGELTGASVVYAGTEPVSPG